MKNIHTTGALQKSNRMACMVEASSCFITDIVSFLVFQKTLIMSQFLYAVVEVCQNLTA